MYYAAEFIKRECFFQKHYKTEANKLYITDKKRAKKAFLKSGIKNVVFKEDVLNDCILAPYLKPLYAYDENFIGSYCEDFLKHLLHFLKKDAPLDEIAVFSPFYARVAANYSKLVTIVGEGEDYYIDGVYIRYVKKMKSTPDVVIITNKCKKIPQWSLAAIDLRENPLEGSRISSWKTMSFKCDEFPFEVGAEVIMYLLKEGEGINYGLVSLRKKLPRLFTFC